MVEARRGWWGPQGGWRRLGEDGEVGDEEGALVPRMGWASRMIICDEEVNMSVEDGLGRGCCG